MNAFDYILALYSIIAGVGVSALVKGVARMVEGREHLRLYWAHTGWVFFLAAVHVISWFGLWALKEHDAWSPPETLVLLLIPLLLNAASYLAIPSGDLKDAGDMRAYYVSQVQWLHGLVILVMVSGAAVVRMIEGRWTLTPVDIMRIAVCVILAPSLVAKRSGMLATQTILLLLTVAIAIFWVVDPLVK